MTKEERAEITRMFGKGLAAKELRRLDLTHDNYLTLKKRYEALGMHLGWSQKRHMWWAWRVTDTGPGSCNILSHYAGNLERFLDPNTIYAEFCTKQPGTQPTRKAKRKQVGEK